MRRLLPALAAVILAAPCLGTSYLYDDYDFLSRARAFRLESLRPDPHLLFYRPLSRELWFGLVAALHLDSPVALHLLNALWLALAVLLLATLADRLLGPRAALIAGFTFAGLGSIPVLVGWGSGIQDLMAVAWILAALLLRVEGRNVLAVIATAGAILSKETAVALVPLLVAMDWVLDRGRVRTSAIAAFTGLVIVWAAVHPGLRLLLGGSSGGYLGLDATGGAASLGRSLLTLLQVPTASIDTSAIGARWPSLILACVLVPLAFLHPSTVEPRDPEPSEPSSRRVVGFAVLLAVLPLVLMLAVVRYWAPYYTVLPALGTSLLAATLLRNQPMPRVAGFLVAFLTLGVLSRVMELPPSVTTEINLERTSGALRRVEDGFKKLYPSLAPGSCVNVSVQVHGIEGVYVHMYRFQALRIWYRDLSLITTKPQERRPGGSHEYLFWIVPDLDVAEVDIATLRARSSGARPTYGQFQKTLRAYAFGLANTGESVRAAQLLLRMPEPDQRVWGLDARMAATFLLADGQTAPAEDLLAHVPPMSRLDALSALSGVLAESPPSLDLDESALHAFGIAPTDVAAGKALMAWFADHGYEAAALRFARRVLRSEPDDAAAAAVLSTLSEKRRTGLVTPGQPDDSL